MKGKVAHMTTCYGMNASMSGMVKKFSDIFLEPKGS
jgi:hypothetical protein